MWKSWQWWESSGFGGPVSLVLPYLSLNYVMCVLLMALKNGSCLMMGLCPWLWELTKEIYIKQKVSRCWVHWLPCCCHPLRVICSPAARHCRGSGFCSKSFAGSYLSLLFCTCNRRNPWLTNDREDEPHKTNLVRAFVWAIWPLPPWAKMYLHNLTPQSVN